MLMPSLHCGEMTSCSILAEFSSAFQFFPSLQYAYSKVCEYKIIVKKLSYLCLKLFHVLNFLKFYMYLLYTWHTYDIVSLSLHSKYAVFLCVWIYFGILIYLIFLPAFPLIISLSTFFFF